MKDESYHTTIEVSAAPAQVFDCVNDVQHWFAGKGFEGNSTNLNDEFIFRYGAGDHAHYSKQKLVEFVPGKKVVWLVTESRIDWIENNKEEWTDTKMVFDIKDNGDKTQLRFTHEGLVPELECFPECKAGWNMIIGDWLFKFINKQKHG
jgi:hypothetical protein